jgi:hypothetical protein
MNTLVTMKLPNSYIHLYGSMSNDSDPAFPIGADFNSPISLSSTRLAEYIVEQKIKYRDLLSMIHIFSAHCYYDWSNFCMFERLAAILQRERDKINIIYKKYYVTYNVEVLYLKGIVIPLANKFRWVCCYFSSRLPGYLFCRI